MARNIDQWYHHNVDGSPLKVCYYGNNITSNTLHHTDDVSQQLSEYISNGGYLVDPTNAVPSASIGLLPGEPLEHSSADVSLKESDGDSVPVTTLELTDGAMDTMATQEDSDSEFFDALDRSIRMRSPVAMTTERVKILTGKKEESLTSSLLTSKVLLSSDKDHLTNRSNQQPNVSKPPCRYDNTRYYIHYTE